MNKETLRMQMIAGIITESEYQTAISEEIENEDFQKGINLMKSEMERHINNVSNKEDISDQEKKRRINNIKFVVYDFLDPNTNGGVRPSNNFQFNEDWWNSISPETNPFQFHDAASDLVRAAKGDSFGEKDIPLNESMIGGIVGIGAINQIPPRAKADYEMAFEYFLGERYEVKPNRERDDINEEEVEEGKIEEGAFGDLLSRMEKNTRLTSDILTVAKLAKEDKEGNADKAVQLMMNNHNMSEEEAVEAVTRIFKKAFEWVDSNELNEVEGMEGENPIDAISMDVPLFIRMLEFAREDASTDMDLHDVAEKAIAMSAEGEVLSMDNYEDLVGAETEMEEEI